MIDKPLYGNPLAGGSGQLGGLILPPKQEAPPLAEVYTNPATKQLLDDFGKSDFAKNVNHMQQDHMEIDLNGLPISGNGSYIGSLMQYLKSVGKDNMVSHKNLQKFEPLAQVPDNQLNATPPSVPVYEQTPFLEGVSQDIFGNPNIIRDSDGNPLPSLGPIQDNNAFPIGFGSGDSRDITSTLPTLQFPEGTGPLSPVSRAVTPIVSGPETFEIATQQAPMDPYNRVGQQLMGPNQDEMLGTLKNIEQGIASLVGNYGQDFNSNKSSNYGDFDNFGIGSFFPPYGGMYG